MSDSLKCPACEDPIEPDSLICAACGTRQQRPRASRRWVYVAVAGAVMLETYYFMQAKQADCVVLAVAAAAVIHLLTPKSRRKRKREMADKLLHCVNFEAASQFLGCDGKAGFAIDRRRNRICLLSNDGKKASSRIASHRDILSAELLENGRSVVKTCRESQRNQRAPKLSPTNADALLATLTGKPPTSGKIWQIDLKITVKDSETAAHQVTFLSAEVAKGGVAYGKTNHLALNWFRIVDGFIQRADLEDIRAGDRIGRSQVHPNGLASG